MATISIQLLKSGEDVCGLIPIIDQVEVSVDYDTEFPTINIFRNAAETVKTIQMDTVEKLYEKIKPAEFDGLCIYVDDVVFKAFAYTRNCMVSHTCAVRPDVVVEQITIN